MEQQNSALSVRDEAEYKACVEMLLNAAKQRGATAAEVSASLSSGFSVQVRLGEVETVEFNRDKGVGLTVYFGQRKGSASTSDLRQDSIEEVADAACRIARYTSEDEYAGLADPKLLAFSYPELDLYHPWDLSTEQAIELAKQCEGAGRNFDPRITNSEGASVSTHQHITVYGNSHGFIGSYMTTYHSLSCSLLAQGKGMVSDHDYTCSRVPQHLKSPEEVGRKAAEKALARLNPRRLKTQKTPIIFINHIAQGLISRFLAAISGGQLYRKSSFLVDHLGKPVFSSNITIHELPHIPQALGSSPFDAEGVGAHDRNLVEKGILNGYLLGSYSARKLGLQSTGNAGGSHNIKVDHGDHDLQGLIRAMGRGLLVTEVMGQGVNLLTGDYSRGASGFWIEHGEIQYPVEEITIAGNLKDMFHHVVAVGNDVYRQSHIHVGSMWIEEMTVAGE